jgi:hypothetical protein
MVHHLICEMEDTLAERFKGHKQLPYAHWICFIIRTACELPAEIRAEISDTTIAFLEYDIRQLWASVTREQAPGLGQRQRPEVLETAAEQDETVEGLAKAELADLDAQRLIKPRMWPLTAQMKTTNPSPGTALLGLTTMRPVALAQPPAQIQPWWLSLRG